MALFILTNTNVENVLLGDKDMWLYINYPNIRCGYSMRKDFWSLKTFAKIGGERSGSVVECLTRDRRAAGSRLTGVVVLKQDTFILA